MLNLHKGEFIRWMIIGWFILFAFFIGFLLHYSTIKSQLYVSTQNRYEMMQLAQELRLSSDDLTRFARSYVVTGDKKFYDQYMEVLSIRNGKSARPAMYEGIYWDIDEQTRQMRHPSKTKISLQERFKALPYTADELNLLKLSEANSNQLVGLEIKAFNDFKAGKQSEAIRIMYSQEYFLAKTIIMDPIDRFMIKLSHRTTFQVNQLYAALDLYAQFSVITFLAIFGYTLLIFFYINRKDKEHLTIVKNYSIDLEKEVESRTAELLAAKNEAETATHAKTRFLANMSHELRTPLNAILGFSQILRYKKIEPSSASLINKINIAGNNLLILVNTLLDFSKIESGEYKAEISEFSFFTILDEVKLLFEAQMEEKQLQFHYVNCENEIIITADYQLIKQVIINLLSNAVKFSPHSSQIVIEYALLDSMHMLSIKDEGPGIGEVEIETLFQPYTQGNASKNTATKGTGLGLNICKTIIEQLHHGKIGVHSKPGFGSEFFFQLPAISTK